MTCSTPASPSGPSLQAAVDCLRRGQVIAYPTEGVYGLGCSPFNCQAVQEILYLKNRHQDQGLILIAAGIKDLLPLIRPPVTTKMLNAFNAWPAAITVIFPASEQVPAWIRGKHDSVALRVTAHPLANHLCQAFGGPIVSTSANPSGLPAAITADQVLNYFGDKIPCVLDGDVLSPGKASQIVSLDGQHLRI